MTEAENVISKGLGAVMYTKGEWERGRDPHNRAYNGSQKRKRAPAN